ncbi:hypothetical protein [Hymenobacter lucidus]|uniref:Lipoprotein n=1 Tax=Hymenobacter lucidus TaxID=2880930 RepID=A0ABS8AYF6_9BACT|nr:hypothetical protein [Hymenobacter lucidus]MCB2410804.1 hypothetical protein [Hymenobacter lucidus]
MKYAVSSWLLLGLLSACTRDTPSEQTTTATQNVTPKTPAAVSAPADTLATFRWESEMCSFTGRYDTRKYTAQQLADTHELLMGGVLTTNETVFKPEDIAKLSLDTLEAEYTKVRARLLALELVPEARWQKLKRRKLQSLDNQYRAKKLTMQAYANPAVLLSAPYPASCKFYIRGLATGNDSLIRQTWQQLVREQQRNNSVPESLQRRFEQEAAEPNWRQYAQVELLGFGWWNCVNETIDYVEPTERLRGRYAQLFTTVKSECEEVD